MKFLDLQDASYRGSVVSKFSQGGARSARMYRITELENESIHGKESIKKYDLSDNVMSEGGTFEKVRTEVNDSVYDVGNKP